ncbi:Y-family DNA polymerase [Gemmobacter serpentinus]|uniref:Y-family DNA polymerase n=1 Tax=Gemmobacter serpentinus TaxID=2652247 RepID=UPI00299D88A2|nr:DNA polymerase Y family protein [Gemmobacter serpentinus]
MGGPVALTRRQGNTDVLHCLNLDAETAGLSRGMGLADARAILPDLATRPADPVQEARAQEALRRWAGRYAPQVAADGPDGLVADITGVAHLFGGEDALRDDLHDRMARAGIAVQTAIAPTRSGGHALTRHGGGIVLDGQVSEQLGTLPVTALNIPPDVAGGLNRLGLTRIADLLRVPRAPLVRRFGPDVMKALDKMLGSLPEPVAAPPDPPHFGVRISLPEPIGLTADVMAGLDLLLTRLCHKLAATHMGARRIRLELGRVDGSTARLEIGLARAMRDPARIAPLFHKGIDDTHAGFGIDMLRLVATVTEPLLPAQIVPGQNRGGDEMSDLLSRLGNRLGFDHVLRCLPADSLVPERSFRVVPAAYHDAQPFPYRPRPARPALIFPPEPVRQTRGHPPTRFHWRNMRFSTLRAQGPERITPEWWQDDPAWRSGIRDYWRIETSEGPRLWLFHTPNAPGWYAQGRFP